MPEKPEVMTVVSSLRPKILGKTITACKVYWDRIISEPTTDEFKRRIINQKINDIKTRGKFLVFDLDRDTLLIHLRMEGKFLFRNINDKILKHEHVEFILDNNISFRFHDVRKFGKMYLIDKKIVNEVKPLSCLGKEFYDEDLSREYLYDKLSNKKIPIKNSLLDQSIIAGIGNIYVDEILFKSGISPERRSCDVSLDECGLIIKNTIDVLSAAVEKGGTTIKSFTSSEGVHGLFQNELLVHGKKNDVCPNCGSNIKVTRINGRGTYWCRNCQK